MSSTSLAVPQLGSYGERFVVVPFKHVPNDGIKVHDLELNWRPDAVPQVTRWRVITATQRENLK